MKRILKGLSYTFRRNLGWQDRVIRAIIAIGVLVSWYFGVIAGTVGLILGILAIMILGTAAAARCSITYMADANTMTRSEKMKLDEKGINYE
jgi:hypothetical protein